MAEKKLKRVKVYLLLSLSDELPDCSLLPLLPSGLRVLFPLAAASIGKAVKRMMNVIFLITCPVLCPVKVRNSEF